MPKRGSWTTKFGFYLLAIGSACGLGNLWRFPYIVAENGGGAFVLLYLVLALSVGLPLLIGELIIGKTTRKSILSVTQAYKGEGRNLYKWVSVVSVVLSFVILSYYAVVSGWVLHFVMQFTFALFRSSPLESSDYLMTLMSNGILQVALASVHLILAWLIVTKGVQEGLEKWIGSMMPLFVFLLVILIFKSLSLDTSIDALRFIFYPDFSKLNYSSLISALGHVFFTLSVGMGTMVTFGSYLNEAEHVPTAGFRVTVADTLISILAGLLVFPIVLQASKSRLSDPTLLFEALPHLLNKSRTGNLFGLAFFVCLYIAALGASIGLFEVIVSNVVDTKKLTRDKASLYTGWGALMLATLPAFSSNLLSQIKIGEKGVLEILDAVLITWILPLVAMGMSWVLHLSISERQKEHEFLGPENINSSSLYSHWKFVLKYFIPAIITCGFLLQLIGLIRNSE
jgi:NSS family neurotransmitter:Na+ symporter